MNDIEFLKRLHEYIPKHQPAAIYYRDNHTHIDRERTLALDEYDAIPAEVKAAMLISLTT